MKQRISLFDLCMVFEIDQRDLPDMTIRPGLMYEEAFRNLRIFKNIFRKQRKLLAKKYHPDKTGGDHSKLAEINAMFDLVVKLEVIVKPIVIMSNPGHDSWYRRGYTTASTTANSYYNPW